MAVAIVAATLLCLWPVSAEAAKVRPLVLDSYSVLIGAPQPSSTPCDEYNQACGSVTVTATFAGLSDRPLPDTYPPAGPGDGTLTGTANLLRIYGCQAANGKHLKGFNRKVSEKIDLRRPHGFGYRIPSEGDTLSVTVYTPLFDAQPGIDCPAGAQVVNYEISVTRVKLELTSYWSTIPNSHYAAPGRTTWTGGVPTPSAG